MVRKAAKLAVYEEIMISVKNHQKLATVRDDMALKIKQQVVEQGIYFYKGYVSSFLLVVKISLL